MDMLPFRVVLRLLDYNPAFRARYTFRIRIETTQSFAALPYILHVDYLPSQTVHRFAIRGLGISSQMDSGGRAAAFTHDFAITSDGSATILIERGSKVCTIHLQLAHGQWKVASIAPQDLLDVVVEDSSAHNA
jgi:hypothetical protein